MTSATGGSRTYSLDPSSGGASFARLVFGLLRQRFSGTVTLEQRAPAGQRTIWVRGGMPVFCDWVSPGDRLGELLCEAGVLDLAGLERALASQAKEHRPLGSILVELGLVDAPTLASALRTQCTRKVVRVFATHASEGEATVSAAEHTKGKGDGLGQVNVLSLLNQGVSAYYDEARVEAELGELLAGDLVATPAFARYEGQFNFVAQDAAVLDALARGNTLARLVSPRVSRKRALQLIYVLWVTQMLRTGDDATQAIAKGATASAAARELGVTIGRQTGTKSKPKPKSKTKSKPSPQPKAAAKPKPAPPPAPKPKAEAKPPAPKAKTKPPPPKPEPQPEAPAGDPAFEALLAELEQRVADEANAFVLFGLEIDADRKGVRAVWAELSKSFHPDSLEGRGLGHLRSRVEKVFAALSEAYGILGNKQERAKLREAIELAGQNNLKAGEDAAAVVRNAFEAEVMARDADKFLKAKKYKEAADLYAKAHELSPQDFDIAAALQYSSYRAGAPDPVQARITITALEKIVEEQPICARAYYFMGLLQLGIEDLTGAKTNFAKASKLDKRNIDAERQLRAIRMREGGPTANKPKSKKKPEAKSGFGGFRDLFKKS